MPPKPDTACLNFEETELTLGLPGGSRSGGKRGFSDTVDLSCRRSKIEPRVREGMTDAYQEPQVAGKPPAAKAQVVGWPPVGSFRKSGGRSCTYYVKVAVDGAPYLRKVDLEMYSSYPQLLRSLKDMFACFTIYDAEKDGRLIDPVNGTEYVPTYEDGEGDWMLVGDVPWKMFVSSCKRIRLMKCSEAIGSLGPQQQQQEEKTISGNSDISSIN